jgi:NAD(P)-dependent dehydrogenase (short-subunit alcohol dehydrogenase family)
MSAQTTVIVGGTSGIGLATARSLAASGATVHIVGRSSERLDAIATESPALIGHRADGGVRTQIDAVFDSIGEIDALILTLSGSDGPGPIADLDLTMLRAAFEAKFWADLTVIQAALPHLVRDGSITFLGAITAHAGMAGTAGIAAINGAVEALVRPLAVELAPIRVNAVSPGFVDTPWWSAFPDDVRTSYFEQVATQLPSRAVASAEDVAAAVILLATNRNITGTILEADGGARLVSIG